MPGSEAIVLTIVFLLVLVTMLNYLWMKQDGKEIKRWFKIIMLFVLLIGVRHLNPLRWPDGAIRVLILNLYTPIGMSEEDVFLTVVNSTRWTTRDPRISHFTSRLRTEVPDGFVRRGSTSATLGTYHMFFIFGVDVEARWRFDENGYLTDVVILRYLSI